MIMSQMDLLVGLPEQLSRFVLSEWLELQDLVQLDRSYCSTAARPKYLALIGGPGVVFSGIPMLLKRHLEYIGWLYKRNIRVPRLQLPRDMAIQPELFVSMVLPFFRLCGPSVRAISVQRLFSGPISPYAFFVEVLSLCPNLTELTIPRHFEYSVTKLQQIATSCPSLELLIIHEYNTHGLPGLESLSGAGAVFHNVRELYLLSGLISTECFCGLAAVAPNVNTLTIYNALKLPDFVFASDAKLWGNLTSLDLCDQVLTDRVVCSLLAHCTRLKRLHLQCAFYALTNATMTFIAENCSILSELSIRSDGISDAGVSSVLQHCSLLSTLILDYNEFLTNDTLSAVGQYGKNLRTLSIVECCNFTELGLTTLARLCLTLRHLTFTPDTVTWYNKSYITVLQMFSRNNCEVEMKGGEDNDQSDDDK